MSKVLVSETRYIQFTQNAECTSVSNMFVILSQHGTVTFILVCHIEPFIAVFFFSFSSWCVCVGGTFYCTYRIHRGIPLMYNFYFTLAAPQRHQLGKISS